MRSMLFGVIALLLGCAAEAQAAGPTVHVLGAGANVVEAAGASWLSAAPVQSELVVGADGQTYLGIWIQAPQVVGIVQRAPLAIDLVVDVSGSMSGAKIANARIAASSLLESLTDGDIVGIHAFSNDVYEVAAPTVVSSATRSMLIQRVNSLGPMGGTNMYDGLRVGESRLGQTPASHRTRRLIIISDGIANIGPSSPAQLGELAANGTENGIQVSAIGVGLDYDEHTLGALAMRSAGRLYHLQEPSQMASILREELGHLQQTVATDAIIEIEPAPGVILEDVEAADERRENGRLQVRLGSLFAGQRRELLVRARVPTATVGQHPFAAARLVFRDPSARNAERSHAVALQYGVTTDARVASRSTNAVVNSQLARYQAAQAQLRAVESLERGDTATAQRELTRAEGNLAVAAQAAPAAERVRLEQQARRIHSNRSAVEAVGRSAGAGGAAAPAAARPASLEMNREAYGDMGM